jgi:hypothetical protein
VPLEGLRAWIGEVERRLGVRTRVMLALVAIALGGAGAAIYLAIDTHDTAVSEADVQALQRQLEARIDQVGEAAGGDLAVARLEAEVRVLKGELEALREGAAKQGAGAAGSSGKATEGASRPRQSANEAKTGKETSAQGTGSGGSSGGKPAQKVAPPSSSPPNEK